jgi:hypothetical protein
MAIMSKPILDNVPLQELDVNYIKKFNNYAYGNNYNNDYPIPSFFLKFLMVTAPIMLSEPTRSSRASSG